MPRPDIRTCAYCGSQSICQCKYRHGRKGGFAISSNNVSAETTLAEMKEQLAIWTRSRDHSKPCVWSFSFTELKTPKEVKHV